jgi:predicted signal transduction protein with EAL and GGDEF domain
MSTTTSDSASPDRLQPAIASARVVIGASLAMFPFGWPSLAQPFDLNGTAFQSSASIGIALFPEDGADAAALLTAADTGMYVSKRAGRGRTSFPLGSRRAA